MHSFAFQYLLDIARRLRHPHLLENDYAQWLLSRISSVCKGHLQWISEKAELSDAGIFVANYWVTGRIMGQQSPSWRPPNALTDTPFQIVKAGDYAEVFPEDEARAKAAVQRVYLAWLRGMAQANKRNSFAWPHAGESDVNVFRLDDHLWIWKALETIHKLDLWTTSDQPRVKLGVSLPEDIPKTPEGEDSLKILAKIYGYRNVQREMLRRFTTQSDISRKRMLAVTRSSRETRFLFHARDTVLFYEYGGFLLQETSFRQVWENTIEAQQHHDENQETRWDNALRYALAIVMGADGYSINNEKTPAQLVEASLHVLLKSSSPNGLFAGQLDEATKEPVMFYREDDRDFYFHASFEIPFILLTRATRINKEMEIAPPNKREGDLQENMRHDNIAEFSERLTTQPKRQLMVSELESPVLAQKENIPGIQGGVITKIVQGTQQSQTMKKTMPFNRFVDSSSIVEIDEEWLYNYPAFLSETKALSFQQVREQLERYLIESWDTPSTADLFEQDVELAAGIVASDEELRNNLCRDIAGGNLSICLDILQDSNNRWMRDKLSESLRSEISPVVREFLNNGELRIQDNIPSKPGATNVASFAASVDRPPPDSLMQIAEFLKEDDVSETFEMILREDKSTLMRILKTNNETRKVLQGHLDTDTVIRILRNKTFYEKIAKLFEGKDVAPQPVVLKAATKYLDEIHNRTDGQTEDTWPFQDSAITAIVGDTMKKRTQGKRSKNYADSSLAWQTDLKLWEHYLNKPRTAESAKKRFVGLPAAATINTALICFLGSPDREKLPISLFFDRHRNCELFFFDDTTMSLNTWVTELHLSFYQLVNHDSTLDPGGIPETQRYPLPGSKGNQIIKASVGFRFIGDFFDRYWTCHFVEHLPVDQPSTDWELTKFDSRDRSWRQRKVFELVLVDRILLLLVYSTKQIVEEIKLELGVEPGAFSLVNLRSDNYFSSSEQWQASQQSLQALEDHLELVIANVVGKWETREEDRGTERPRWTHNDEWKYRGDLKKLLASNNSKIRDMRSLHNEIRTLKEFLMSRQDQIRNDLSLRGAENIRLFTYVTVVFLPVGFAASIFSMSGIPDGQLVSPMASTAAVALVLTVFALVNAETLGIIAETISRTIAHYSNVRMNSSYLLRQYKMARQDKEESVDDHNETSRGSIVPKVSSPTSPPSTSHHSATIDVRENGRTQDRNKWHAWFWVVYLVIDLPASRAVLAYSAMKVHKLSIIAVFNVVLGVLVLPWCIIIWMFHLIILNLVDLFRVMKRTCLH